MIRPARVSVRPTAQKQAEYKSYSFPGPSLGLVAMNNMSVAMPGAAEVLENIFPTPTGGVTRRGKQLYATLGIGDKDTTALFSYVIGGKREFFGATEDAIYNISAVTNPANILIGTEDGDIIGTEGGDMIGVQSTEGLDVYTGTTGGKWIVVQFSTAGGTYLIGVNGQDDGFVYDGQTFYPQVANGISKLLFDGGTVEFTAGETVTGGTSGATATIVKIIPDDPDNPEVAGELWVKDVAVAPFNDNEAITDGKGGTAVANGAETLVPGTDLSFPSGVSLTGADLSYVWVYKNRVWFIQKDSLDVWYLPVDQIAGGLAKFPLGGVFNRGGSITFGTTWSQDVGDGLNALCAFISSEGEAAVYQGADPASATDWGIVGVYQTGKPLGAKAHVRIGGDVAIASDIAFVPLSEALRREYSQLMANSLSKDIEALWPKEVQARATGEWNCEFWTANSMIVVGLPAVGKQPPGMLVVNSRTLKWGWFTNWNSTCLHVFNDRLFCGDTDGRVFELNVTGLDDGDPYTSVWIPSFDQMGEIGTKNVHLVRPVIKSSHRINPKTSVHGEYSVKLPTPPAASLPTVTSQWGAVKWGDFAWGAGSQPTVQQAWRNQFGAGEVVSVGLQITSGSLVPLDVELVRLDALFTTGAVIG